MTHGEDAGGVDVAAIYRSHWHSMVRLAVLLLHDVPSAEDAVQDAFVSLHRNRSRLDDPEAAIGYVRSAVANRCRSLIRRRAVARRHVAVVGMDPEAVADPATYTDQQLMGAVHTLPRRTREVIVLRYWADLSEAEIADTLGVSTGTVKSTASRGLVRLREMLGDAL